MESSDICTIVSLVPFPIPAQKPGLIPGYFEIAPARDGLLSVLKVGQSVYYTATQTGQIVTIPVPAKEVARSIVDDYLDSQLARKRGEAEPGIFWLPGEYTATEVLAKHADLIKSARERMNLWFRELVKIADDDWSRTHVHRTISNMQRTACRMLGLDRDWAFEPIEGDVKSKIRCPACTSAIAGNAVICPNCRCVLNMEAVKKFEFR